MFGVNHIADILCGSKNKKICNNRHDKLLVYGTGKEYSKEQWKSFIKELIRLNYLKIGGYKYPLVMLTDRSHIVLSDGASVLLTKPDKIEQVLQKDVEGDFDYGLFEILRNLRKKLADEEGMPPYIIFHDSSLKAMATYFPQSLMDFQKINGVGANKLEKYGGVFVKEIINYREKHEPNPSFPIKKDLSDESKTYLAKEIQKIHSQAYESWTKEDDEKLYIEYLSGKSIDELMEQFERQRGDIISRLKRLNLIP